ncbi:hypothetical protein F0562_034811 [Nyssa sinensis]|uniref:RNase H type-1 domain-containing protein n=1 Tax=Nyssa sinensis TaxID=561372 RepID=A0A5J5AB55_9ASTE|nr:hypothetical protein F0562_034811 [Nyssa sinensis]
MFVGEINQGSYVLALSERDSVGGVIRDTGLLCSAAHAEALAILYGLLFAKDIGIYEIILKSGGLSVLKSVVNLSDDMSELANITTEAKKGKKFKVTKTTEEVKKMDFNPVRVKFVTAIHALRAMSKSVWKKKMEVFKKWGLSEDEVLVAFGKHPWCMMTSEDKITGVMDFFVNKMGWESSIVAKRPGLLTLSLEKRIVPRCLVYQVLLSKGLIKEDFSLATMLEYPEKLFLKKVTSCCDEEAPELLKFYQEKLDLSK